MSAPTLYTFTTYFPLADQHRYLVTRPLDWYSQVTVGCAAWDGVSGSMVVRPCLAHARAQAGAAHVVGNVSYASPAALVAVSSYWASVTLSNGTAANITWATSGVVIANATADGAPYSLSQPVLGYLLTTNMTVPQTSVAVWGGNEVGARVLAADNLTLVTLYDCAVPSGTASWQLDHAITREGECEGAFAGTQLRRLGWAWLAVHEMAVAAAGGGTQALWVAPAATPASARLAADGGDGNGADGSGSGAGYPTAFTFFGALVRCTDGVTGTHFATFNDDTCGGTPGGGDPVTLGYIYAPLIAP